MGRARRDRRDQERKARRKRKLNKEGDANVEDANSFPIQQRQRRTTPEAAEAAPNGDGGSTIYVEAVAGDSIAGTGRGIPSEEEEKQTTASPSMATNPASKMSKQEQQRLKMQQRKELRKAKKAASAFGAQQVEEERKRVAQALAQIQSRQKQEEQLLLQNKFVSCSKGVQYCEIRIGKGSLLKQEEDISVKYVLRAKEKRGKILGSNDHFEFQLGKGDVIEGWDIGMEGMRRGGARHLIVPKDAGYADKDIGGGAGADLYFEIEVHLR